MVSKQATGLQAKLPLDLGDGRQMAEDDQAHAKRINEIRAGSKVKCQRIHRFVRISPRGRNFHRRGSAPRGRRLRNHGTCVA
jgi:hypothetical protein